MLWENAYPGQILYAHPTNQICLRTPIIQNHEYD